VKKFQEFFWSGMFRIFFEEFKNDFTRKSCNEFSENDAKKDNSYKPAVFFNGVAKKNNS